MEEEVEINLFAFWKYDTFPFMGGLATKKCRGYVPRSAPGGVHQGPGWEH